MLRSDNAKVSLVALLLLTAGLQASAAPATAPADKEGWQELTESKEPVHALAISPDGKTVAVGTEGKSVRLYSLPDGKLKATLRHGNWVCQQIKFSDDGEVLFCHTWNGLFGGVKQIDVWRLRDEKRLLSSADPALDKQDPLRLMFLGDMSPDGKWAAFSSGFGKGLYTLELATGKRVQFLPEEEGPILPLFLREPGLLAAWSSDPAEPGAGAYRLLDAAKGLEMAAFRWERSAIVSGARPAGHRVMISQEDELAVGWIDLKAAVWSPLINVEDEAELAELVASSDGVWFATAAKGHVKLYRAGAGKPLASLSLPRTINPESKQPAGDAIASLAVAENGSLIVVAGKSGKVWVHRVKQVAKADQ